MKIYHTRVLIKYIFVVSAIAISLGFLIVSNQMASDMASDERVKMELWADAINKAATDDGVEELDLTLKILSSNTTIPVVLCDEFDNVLMSVNIDVAEDDSVSYLNEKVVEFKNINAPIIIESPNFEQRVYYGDSSTLKRLQYYPKLQIGVMAIFVCVSFLALLSTKKAEQNKLWVGLSKETAHQLGTPISSMLAWIEYLKTKSYDVSTLNEMEKDAMRLQVVADRFSKIGSTPSPQTKDVGEELIQSVSYLEKRISKKVKFEFDIPETPLYAKITDSLFSWVVENLTKNAVDAMEGQGNIMFKLSSYNGKILIDITDSGKGLPKSMFKSIFSPGFTTKERGWGLGLSLAKRIIEDYHKGKIYVKSSELGVGTIIRIELKQEV